MATSMIRVISKETFNRFGVRFFRSSNILCEQFTIQDTKDFDDKVIKSSKPVIVNFRASWCGPCKMLTPRLEAVVEKRGDVVNLAKVDIDDQADIAMEYNVEAVPTVISFKNGKIVDKFVGLREDDQINSFIDAVAAK